MIMFGGLTEPEAPGSLPWTFALNRTATNVDAAVTLLALTVVGGVARISGLVRLRRSDLRLARVPDLAIAPSGGPRLILIGGHLLPQGDLTWVSWVFARPREVLAPYAGDIPRLDLGSKDGRHEVAILGPWEFNFHLLRGPMPSRRRLP